MKMGPSQAHGGGEEGEGGRGSSQSVLFLDPSDDRMMKVCLRPKIQRTRAGFLRLVGSPRLRSSRSSDAARVERTAREWVCQDVRTIMRNSDFPGYEPL